MTLRETFATTIKIYIELGYKDLVERIESSIPKYYITKLYYEGRVRLPLGVKIS